MAANSSGQETGSRFVAQAGLELLNSCSQAVLSPWLPKALELQVFKTKIELQSWQNWTKRKENYLCRTSLQQIILELALHSRDPLLIRTSGITLSSSILQPNRRQLCSMLMHIHLDTSSLKTLHLGTLFFLFYLALTQNEENICDGKVTL
ncbi:SOSS complex subunit C isoform X1 [Pan paniscus]|uniref:SOSS complex subunit C isoform X1 n=1 Tax=Pan paniscus TaxID=9597 RepID=UPI0025463F9A|nr:SOSS complex subunit C isoform X1 [Pan paniscus]